MYLKELDEWQPVQKDDKAESETNTKENEKDVNSKTKDETYENEN